MANPAICLKLKPGISTRLITGRKMGSNPSGQTRSSCFATIGKYGGVPQVVEGASLPLGGDRDFIAA